MLPTVHCTHSCRTTSLTIFRITSKKNIQVDIKKDCLDILPPLATDKSGLNIFYEYVKQNKRLEQMQGESRQKAPAIAHQADILEIYKIVKQCHFVS